MPEAPDGPQLQGPKRILSLDAGGLRGSITTGILEGIEATLRRQHGDPQLVLSDYFDLIGGTSSGALLATGLALGLPVQQLLERLHAAGSRVFSRHSWRPWQAVYDPAALEEELVQSFGGLTLDSSELRTGLALVVQRADTGSTWTLLNHPDGTFFEQNRHLRLVDCLLASTALPALLPSKVLEVGPDERGIFIDGGASAASNPSWELLLVATLKGFPFRWPTGEDRLMLCSVGTGRWRRSSPLQRVERHTALDWALELPGMLLENSVRNTECLLQAFSTSSTPWIVDSEKGDLGEDLLSTEPLIRYLRYNVDLDEAGLTALGLEHLVAHLKRLRKPDGADSVDDLLEIGRAVAERSVQDAHFPSCFAHSESVWPPVRS